MNDIYKNRYLENDVDILSVLLSFGMTKKRARSISVRLIKELHTLSRVVFADVDTFERYQLPEKCIELVITFRETLSSVMRRELRKMPIVSDSDILMDYLHVAMANRQREQFRILFLDVENRLILDEIMSNGSVNQTSVYIREVVKRALDLHAGAIIMAHNHPSGNTKPSRDDINLTRQIIEALRPLGIIVHDHIILGSAGHASLRQLSAI
jgi:DNA repair protein RadC